MARSTVTRVTSDLSGKEIPENEVWTLTLVPPDGRSNTYRLDLSAEEAKELAAKGQEVKRRGRKPGSKNKPKG